MKEILENTFTENIGNQEYHFFDTVRCVSITGHVFDGLLFEVGNSCFIKVLYNEWLYEFRYKTVNPLRKVLIEKVEKMIYLNFEFSNK